jgi:hypothetical protein
LNEFRSIFAPTAIYTVYTHLLYPTISRMGTFSGKDRTNNNYFY